LQITQAALPAMIARQRGSIIMINSMVVRKPLPTIGAYIASKGALLAGARSLARELGVHGIRVNSVVPGWIWGPSVKQVLQDQASAMGTSQEEQYALVAKDIALGKIPLPSECADAVVFFASDLSRAVTGQALDINGGDVFH
jgi:NAD(P)-dependent dehydrogenase (short-subunit alcohol dehydrogenase family)